MYVYQSFERGLWTVGFYRPDGKWIAESDHDIEEKAAERVAWLNGGSPVSEKEEDDDTPWKRYRFGRKLYTTGLKKKMFQVLKKRWRFYW